MRVCGSAESRSKSAAVSRDLPIPASPESSTTWPSPLFAFDQRRSSSSSSSSRPTRAVRPVACSASKRPSAELARSAAKARTGPVMPFEVSCPQVLKLEQIAKELAGVFSNHHAIRVCNALQTRRKVGRLAYNGLLLRSARADQIADDHQSRRDTDTSLEGC